MGARDWKLDKQVRAEREMDERIAALGARERAKTSVRAGSYAARHGNSLGRTFRSVPADDNGRDLPTGQ